jgi:hypothetical protein
MPPATLLTLVRYIHRNPVRAGMVKDPADYLRSSQQAYIGHAGIPWLSTEFVLSMFGGTLEHARGNCRAFMATPGADDRVRGTDHLVEKLPAVVYRRKPDITLEDFIGRRCADLASAPESLRSVSRRRSYAAARAALATKALDQRIATLSELARYFNRDIAAFSRCIERYRGTVYQ